MKPAAHVHPNSRSVRASSCLRAEVLPSGAVPPDLRDAPAAPRRWLLLALLTVAYGMGAFGILGVSPLLPSLVEGFRLTRLDVAFVVPSVYLGGLLFSLPAGH